MKNQEEVGLVCVVTGLPGAEPHHLFTRKSWPQLKDKDWNKIPVCRYIHQKFHSKGTNYMADTYPKIKEWLLKNDWTKDPFRGTWTHDRKD